MLYDLPRWAQDDRDVSQACENNREFRLSVQAATTRDMRVYLSGCAWITNNSPSFVIVWPDDTANYGIGAYAGGGTWTDQPRHAKRYATRGEAQAVVNRYAKQRGRYQQTWAGCSVVSLEDFALPIFSKIANEIASAA